MASIAVVFGATGCAIGSAGDESNAGDGKVTAAANAAAAAPGATDPRVFGGVVDTGDNSVVALRITLEDGSAELCSGALIANNVVLTARHCVTPTIVTEVICNANGTSGNGRHFAGDVAPSAIEVFRGTKSTLTGAPAALGSAIFHDDATIVCDHDVALLVLDRALTSVKPYAVRLSSGVAQGEDVSLVGYGQNDNNLPLGTRLDRKNLSILSVGAGISSSNTALGNHEFELGAGSCEGDSGGPAISAQTGAIVGVVSRGGACTDNFGHVFTETADTQSIFVKAFAVAGGAPVLEAGDTTSAPDQNAQAVPATDSGCSQSPASSDFGGAGLLVASALASAIARRRKR